MTTSQELSQSIAQLQQQLQYAPPQIRPYIETSIAKQQAELEKLRGKPSVKIPIELLREGQPEPSGYFMPVTPAELEQRYGGMPPKEVLREQQERIEYFQRVEKARTSEEIMIARPEGITDKTWVEFVAGNPDLSISQYREKWGLAPSVMEVKPLDVSKSEWERFVVTQNRPQGALFITEPPESTISSTTVRGQWDLNRALGDFRSVEKDYIETKSQENYDSYIAAYDKVKAITDKLYEESWKVLKKEFEEMGVLTDKELATIKSNLNYIRSTPEKGDPTTRSNEYLKGWSDTINIRLKNKAIKEARVLPKPVWYQVQESPVGQFPVVGWLITGFVKALEPIGALVASPFRAAIGEEPFVTTMPSTIYYDTERIRLMREPTLPEQVFQIGGEALSMVGLGGLVGLGVKGIAPVIPRVSVTGKLASKIIKIAKRYQVAKVAMITGLGVYEAYKIKSMLDAGYSEEQIGEVVEKMRTTGFSEEVIEEKEKELHEVKFYTTSDIVLAVASDVAKMGGFAYGISKGLKIEQPPIGVSRVEVGKETLYRGLRIGERPLIGRAGGRWIIGRPKPEVLSKMVKEHLVPYMEKHIYTPKTPFEKTFAFKSFLPHLSKELQGTMLVVDKAGVLRFVSPKLFGQVGPTIKEGFIRAGLTVEDSNVVFKIFEKYGKKTLIGGSTSKELQWLPVKDFEKLPKECRWLYEIRKASLHRDIDMYFMGFRNTKDLTKFVDALKTGLGNKLVFKNPGIGTYKISVTKTGKQIFDAHSPLSEYISPKMAWGYRHTGYPELTQGWIKRLKLSGLGEEHIHELSTHGWSRITLKDFLKNLKPSKPIYPKEIPAGVVSDWSGKLIPRNVGISKVFHHTHYPSKGVWLLPKEHQALHLMMEGKIPINSIFYAKYKIVVPLMDATPTAVQKLALSAGWSPIEIKQGWRIVFMSNRAKDTVRQILSGYTLSIREYGLQAGLKYYKPAADFLRGQLIVQGVSEKSISELLVEGAKDLTLFYAPSAPSISTMTPALTYGFPISGSLLGTSYISSYAPPYGPSRVTYGPSRVSRPSPRPVYPSVSPVYPTVGYGQYPSVSSQILSKSSIPSRPPTPPKPSIPSPTVSSILSYPSISSHVLTPPYPYSYIPSPPYPYSYIPPPSAIPPPFLLLGEKPKPVKAKKPIKKGEVYRERYFDVRNFLWGPHRPTMSAEEILRESWTFEFGGITRPQKGANKKLKRRKNKQRVTIKVPTVRELLGGE